MNRSISAVSLTEYPPEDSWRMHDYFYYFVVSRTKPKKQNQPKHGENSWEKVPLVAMVEKFSVEDFQQKVLLNPFQVISEEHTSFT